eukprot:g7374.t1
MLSFFTEKLAEGYNLDSVAKNPHVLSLMKGMGAILFIATNSSSIANRLEDKKTMSMAAFANFLVHVGFIVVCYFDLQDFKTMGVPLTGVYVNIGINCVLAYLNYGAWKETGGAVGSPPPFTGQSSLTNCLRVNNGMGLAFGLWALLSHESMLAQYLNDAPTDGDVAVMLKVITRTLGFFLIGNVLKTGVMISSDVADAQYYAVRGSAFYWFFCCGSLTQAGFMKDVWKSESYNMNVVMQFGMFLYATYVMLQEDKKSAKKD